MFAIVIFIIGAILGFITGFFVFRNNKEKSENIAQKIEDAVNNIGK